MSKASHIPNYVFFIGLLALCSVALIAYDVNSNMGYKVALKDDTLRLIHGGSTLDGFDRFTKITPVSGSNYLIIRTSGNKYGVISANQLPIIETDIGAIYAIMDLSTQKFTGLFFRKIDINSYALYSPSHNVINTFAYISELGSDNRVFVRDSSEKVGFIDYQGKIAIKPAYYYFKNEDLIKRYCHFFDGLCPIMDSNDKFGYIDTNGENQKGFPYDLALPFENSIATVYIRGKSNFININQDALRR